MNSVMNPALSAFAAAIADELEVAQALVRRDGRGFALRHIADRAAREDNLRIVPVAGLRVLAQCDTSGAFRPLKAAPTLVRGWRARAADDAELGAALEQLYPGAVADWFAARPPVPPVTGYREFTARQTGMYRLTAMLEDAQAARVITTGCDARHCLKRRLWSVAGLAPDEAAGKSVIPCLEPCAVLLESARKAARKQQEDGADKDR